MEVRPRSARHSPVLSKRIAFEKYGPARLGAAAQMADNTRSRPQKDATRLGHSPRHIFQLRCNSYGSSHRPRQILQLRPVGGLRQGDCIASWRGDQNSLRRVSANEERVDRSPYEYRSLYPPSTGSHTRSQANADSPHHKQTLTTASFACACLFNFLISKYSWNH